MSLASLGAVTVAGYRLHTGDLETNASAVSGSLLEAEEILDDELRRSLALEERTDTFKLYPDGRVYPDAWPLVSADLQIEGRALLGGTPDVTVFIGYFPGPAPPRATVTWTGGYDATTLPRTLRNAVYDLAEAVGSDPSPVPVGALSASVGDVSVTFAEPTGGLDGLVPGLSDAVRKYRNRWV